MSAAALVALLRRRYAPPASDTESLRAYADRHDQAAFGRLVERYGPLVLRLCRRLLGDSHAAEDAFQATFLVLARRAGSVRRPEALASWLHGVARRVCRNARAARDRRRAAEANVCPPAVVDPASVVSARELLDALDEELDRLPERYRSPLALVYWQGLSRAEAARRLGLTLGALHGRLERGRAKVADRLTRRGFAPSALLVAPLATAAVSPDLLAATATLAVDPWSKALPSAVLALAAGSSKLMPTLATVLLAGAFALAGTGFWRDGSETDGTPSTVAYASGSSEEQPPLRLDRFGDPLPPGAVTRLGTTRFLGSTVVFAPDGKALLTRFNNAGIRLLDDTTGQTLATIADVNRESLGAGPVDIAGVLPDGKAIVSKGTFLPLALWDLRTGQRLRTFGEAKDQARLTSAAVSSDGRWLACGRRRGPLSVFDVASGQERYRVEPISVGLWKTAFSADGKVLAAAEWDAPAHIRILDGANGDEHQRLPDVDGGLGSLALAPSGRLLAWTRGHDVSVWDIGNCKLLHNLSAPGEQWDRDTLAFSPDGKMLAATAYAAGIVLWDTTTGQELRRWVTGNRHHYALAFSPDGQRAAVTGDTGRITVWEVATGRRVAPEAERATAVSAVAVAPDGQTVVTGGRDSFVRLWETQTGREVRSFRSPFDHIMTVAFAPDGRTMAGGGYEMVDPWNRGGLRWWDVQTGAEVGSVNLPEGGYPLAFPPARDLIFAGSFTNSQRFLWNSTTGQEVYRFGGQAESAASGTMTPDGRRLVTSSEQGAVVVWDRETGKLRTMASPADLVPPDFVARFGSFTPHVAISADGRSAAGAFGKYSIGVWEVASGLRRRTIRLNEFANPVAFSSDGRTLAYGASSDGENDFVVVRDLATDTEIARFASQHGRVTALAFSPDGRLVVSGGTDTTALVWPVPPPAALPLAVNLEDCWADLAGDDADRAYTSHWRLTAVPAQAVPFLQERLRPAAPLTQAQRSDALRAIADLDNPRFTVRQQAAQRLGQFGELAIPLLNEALAKKPAAEARQQLERLTDQADAPPSSGQRLQALRAVELLEHVGNAAARQLLAGLAKGDPTARLTREAQASLERLRRR